MTPPNPPHAVTWQPHHPYSVTTSQLKTPRSSQSLFPQLNTPLAHAPNPPRSPQPCCTEVLANRPIPAGQTPPSFDYCHYA